MSRKIHELIAACKERLAPICHYDVLAEQEAWWMIENIMGKTQAELLVLDVVELTQAQQETLDSWLMQRVKERKPLQYLLGFVPFCDVEILVQPPILIPRPETEEWVTWLVNQLEPVKKEPLKILDLCTGSGCIALALAKALPLAQVIGVDKNPRAIELAKKNKQHNKLINVEFIESDLYNALQPQQQFDLLVSNPPYLSEQEWLVLDEGVRAWEDYDALVAHHQGYAFYEHILLQSSKYLKTDNSIRKNGIPQIVLEIGIGQKSIRPFIEKFCFSKITIYNDLEGVARWVAVQV